ncbi:MAG: molybdopterin-dependent oxidoreductase [Vicinamibacterales bacterium]
MSAESSSSLVERRLRYLERQRALQGEAAARDAAVRRPMGSGPPNRHGLPTVPTGQRVVPNWPVLDLGHTPDIAVADWRLEVSGLCAHPLSLTWADFLDLPQVDDESDFHCVTTWSRLDNRWRGVRFQTLAELAVPAPEARFVSCTGYDVAPGTSIPYTTNLALARAVEADVLLVHTWEGRPLPREHGGPCRMITPKLYAWKGAKWIRRIEFLAEDRPGFWEVRGYSNTAEPWLDDRYAD